MSGRIFLVLLCSLAIAMLPTTALAADPITVNVDNIAINYPDEIVFKANASSTAGNVTALTLHTVVGGSPAERANTVPITAGPSVQGEYRMKTGGNNHIPPGTDLTYWLDAQDSAGNKLTALKQVFWYADTRFQWQKYQDGAVTVYYYGNALDAAKLVASAAHDDQEKGGAMLGVQARPFKVMLYNTARDIIGAQPIQASQTFAQNLIREGIAYSTEELVQVLNQGSGTADIARHEITHLYVGWVGGNSVPAWLNEGLAVWSQKSNDYTGYLRQAVSNNTLHLIRGLEGYSGTPETFLQAYGEGASIVTYMIDTYGGEKFRQLIESHKVSEGTEVALKRLYGLDLNQLDAEWRKFLGAPPRSYESSLPTPTAFQSIPALDATPSANPSGSSSSPSGPSGTATPPLLPIVGGAIVVMVLAAGGLALIKRNSA